MAAASPSSTSATRPRRSRTSPPPPRRRRWASRRAPRSRRPGGGRAAGRRPPRRTPRPSSPAWASSCRVPPPVTRRPRRRRRRWRAAAERFAALLGEFPDSARAREAAYYRFRALDVARASDRSLTPAYEQALDAYLSAYPRHEGAAEARYLLAELHRARGDCKRAEAEYAAGGTGPFAARARLGGLEGPVASLGTGCERRTEMLT